MLYQFPLFAFAHAVAAVLSLTLAVVVYTRRANPGYLHLCGLLLNLAFWSATTFMEVGVLSVEGKRFWSQLQYLAIVSLSPVWLLFAAHLSNKRKFLSNPWRHLIWVIPIITLFAAFTDQRYGLLWGKITIPQDSPHPIAVYSRGPLFYPHIISSYLYLLIGTIWMVQAFFQYPRKRKRQLIIILVLLALGWLANLIYILGFSPIPGLDLTSLSFTFITVALFWFITRNQLFNIVPIARGQVFDTMTDGIIVIDNDDIIIDINPAALDITSYKGPPPLGMSIWDMFADYADLVEPLRGPHNLHEELEIPTNPPRCLDVQVTAVKKSESEYVGQIITIREITKRKILEKIQADQRQLAEALADTAATINSTLELEEVLQRILENVGKVVPHDAANISLVDEHGIVRFVRASGYERYGTYDQLLNLKFNLADVPNMRKMAQTGQPSMNPDTLNDPDWVKGIHGDFWIRSYLGVSIISRGKLLGFIGLDAETPNFFKAEQMNRLRAFADQAAIAINNAQLYSISTRRAEEMRTLYEVGLAITSGLGLEKTIQSLYEQIRKVIPVDFFYLALTNPDENNLSFHAYDDKGIKLSLQTISLVDRPSLTRYTIEQRRTVYLPDIHAPDSEFPFEQMVRTALDDQIHSHLGVPLMLGSRVLGVLAVRAKTVDAYSPDQIRLVETIASQASMAMENARMFDEIQHQAITDSLTGLYNRRFFFQFAQKEIERARRYQKHLSIIMMDIDHFKIVNDRFGHQAGDLALKMVTQTCLAQLRKVDVMCRFGGEEFVVLLPETSRSKASQAAQRMREAIAAARLPVNGGEISLTVSIGVAELEDGIVDVNALIQLADQALYQAKEAGRNRVKAI